MFSIYEKSICVACNKKSGGQNYPGSPLAARHRTLATTKTNYENLIDFYCFVILIRFPSTSNKKIPSG